MTKTPNGKARAAVSNRPERSSADRSASGAAEARRIPHYLRAKAEMAARIARGDYTPGQMLPSEFALAAEFSVSQGTMRKALDLLTAEGRLTRRQGKGTFVSTPRVGAGLDNALPPRMFSPEFFPLVADDGLGVVQPVSEIRWLAQSSATTEEAAALGVPPDAPVYRLARLRRLAGASVISETVTLLRAAFEGFDKAAPGEDLFADYAARFGISVARVSERMKAVPAGMEEAEVLDVKPGTPLLCIWRIARDGAGRAVEFRRTHALTRQHFYQPVP